MTEQRVRTGERVDRILELLDVGDQHTSLAHYGYADDVEYAEADEWVTIERRTTAAGTSPADAVTAIERIVIVWIDADTEAFARAVDCIRDAFAALAAQLGPVLVEISEAVDKFFNTQPDPEQEDHHARHLRRILGGDRHRAAALPRDTGYLRRSDAAATRAPRRRLDQRFRRGA